MFFFHKILLITIDFFFLQNSDVESVSNESPSKFIIFNIISIFILEIWLLINLCTQNMYFMRINPFYLQLFFQSWDVQKSEQKWNIFFLIYCHISFGVHLKIKIK